MADKAISELVAASQVKPADLFVLEQDGAAKKLTGQTLENWLVTLADGHGGIQSITKTGTSGLKDTYRITLADETYQDIQVTNGRGITGFAKTGTSGLVDTWRVSYNDGTHTDISVTNGRGITKNELVSTSGLVKTYRITYNDGTTQTYTVTDGAKGDKGDNTYTHVKYASQQPTASSHSMGDIPDAWRGEYNGPLEDPPTDWQQYKWYKTKGDKGDTGDPATLVSSSVTYLVSDRGDIVPSGSWSTTIPTVSQGKYLWTRVIQTYNTGSPITSYSVSRFGIDGTGSVSSVNSQNPDSTGNVKLTAADIAGSDGQSVEAALAGKQAKITSVGLLKGTGNGGVTDAVAGVDYQAPITAGAGIKLTGNKVSTAAAPRNLLDNSDFRNPVNQRGQTNYSLSAWGGYCIDRWAVYAAGANVTISSGGLTLSRCIHQPISSDVVSMYNGKVLTLAVKIAGTVYCCSGEVNQTGAWHPSARVDTPYGYISFETEDSNMMFVIIDNSTTPSVVEWAALYEGEYTAETLPEYQPKGHGAELLECQRYYQIRSANNISAVDMRPTMRLSSPTITSVTNGYAYSADL